MQNTTTTTTTTANAVQAVTIRFRRAVDRTEETVVWAMCQQHLAHLRNRQRGVVLATTPTGDACEFCAVAPVE